MRKEVEFKNIDRFVRLGVAIGAIRKMKGMSQEQLAEKANISRSHLSVIESTSTVRPFSLEVLFDIADAFEMDIIEIIEMSRNLDKPSRNIKED